MYKIVEKDNRIFFKKNNKIVAFIGRNKENEFYYAFGKPSQSGGYISFIVDTIETAKNRVIENLNIVY